MSCKQPDLFQPHPHLSDAINRAIVKSEIDGGVFLREVPSGTVIEIETRNRFYEIEKITDRRVLISGHPEYCPEPVEVTISGSTWGGSMLKMDFIGREMCLEFHHPDYGIICTTQISEIRELPRRDETSPRALARILALGDPIDLAPAA